MPPVIALALVVGCAPPGPRDPVDRVPVTADTLVLRWVRAAPTGSWAEAEAGLWWSLLALGAWPEPDALVVLAEADDSVTAALDPAALGLDAQAQVALEAALEPLLDSDERVRGGAVDVGRLLMRTLYEPWVYYAVTGACSDLDGWLDGFPGAAEDAAITASMLTEGDRLVRFPTDASTPADVRWLAEEGDGSLEAGDFVARATEVVDVLPNGRFRYAVYGADGTLEPTADPAHTPAGQPGRCMWCHEWHLMPTVVQPELPGFAPFERFLDAIDRDQALVDDQRRATGGPVDWFDPDVHQWAERLVDGFLAPPTDRLAREWGVDAGTVEAWMVAAGAAPVADPEFPEWGTAWRRSDADAVLAAQAAALGLGDAPWTALPVLEGYRDLDSSEPTFGRELAGADCGL